MSKKKKSQHDDHINESWLIPYADLLTLLLALFIVLFASSQIDQKKFQEIARSFSSALSGGAGVLDFPSPVEQDNPQTSLPDKEKLTKNQQAKNEQKELQQIQAKINQYIEQQHLQGELKTTLTEEGLLVTILNDVLFDSGSAEVRLQDRQIASEISRLLVMNPPRNIIVSGHTDNVPIRNSNFSSNWELSVMRAVNFMKLLLENKQLDPRLFSAKGYGEFKPVASNATPEGRMKNRRVEILIAPNTTAN
ncbi:membrane MotB of proton-channel complex MotA/MotB family protein [Anoxybacillus sp. B7M1]|jgi:chemotaxis protein MotB|uniref:flagellar motor protein MotB n=1 Tax=unclassified Anoxybacillus TaxID=2639704 RepID=UPI0005CDA2F5|nr:MULTISPECIES: flagellar motor protein MotB [unclassified Anoxybacillus]ANB57877.1 membrane MotB of proton-channel complex MotA/MotB family protein [Anoxybacillus sp. B2M1]ANB63902.1 membrane MotB of proton-channel complex MotA/MotB family protein [Anoxybacillus sp. B7M1]